MKSARSEPGRQATTTGRLPTTRIISPPETQSQSQRQGHGQDQNNKWINPPSSNTIVVKLSPKSLSQPRSSPIQDKVLSQVSGPKHLVETALNTIQNNHSSNSNNSNTLVNNNNSNTSTNGIAILRGGFPERSQHVPFNQHRKILTRQSTPGRSFDGSAGTNNTIISNNEKSNSNHGFGTANGVHIGTDLPSHSPRSTTNSHHQEATVSVRKIIPKQFVPFRSAQDRPKISKNYVASSLRQLEKSKAIDVSNSNSMALQGIPVRMASEEESVSPIKRPGSPHRPVVVRRRLAKRHRLGDVTGSGTHVIRDVDQSVTTDLFASECMASLSNSHHVTTPLPSIGQSNTPR